MKLIYKGLAILALNLISYICFLAVVFFFGGGGHGSYIPFTVFWAWSAIFFVITPNTLTFFLPPIAQTVIYGMIGLALGSQLTNIRKFIFFPALHLFGVIISTLFLQQSSIHGWWLAISFIVSIFFCIGYWIAYFRLLNRVWKNEEK